MDSFKILPTPEWMGPELRDFKRIDVDVPVSLYPLIGGKPASQTPIPGRIRDLSVGGLLVQVDQFFRTGSRVLAAFTLAGLTEESDAEELEIVCLVRQEIRTVSDELMYGLQYKSFEKGSAETIESVVEAAT